MLWAVYLAITIACATGYLLAGMNWFDALTHAFATIATGGFGNYDASLAAFDSPLIESVAVKPSR